MAQWYVDEGLTVLIGQWKKKNPGAVVYTIGDDQHSSDPDVTQHAPDDGGPAAGDDRGEVDAGDFMPGKGGVTKAKLQSLFDDLVSARDPRILYVIWEDKIVSSVVRPWVVRTHVGAYHSHVHVSCNDTYDANRKLWTIGGTMRKPTLTETNVKLPVLTMGDEDAALDGYNHVKRAQLLANWIDNTTADVDVDGVYGAKTANKIARVMKDQTDRSTPNGRKIGIAEWRKLMGLYRP